MNILKPEKGVPNKISRHPILTFDETERETNPVRRSHITQKADAGEKNYKINRNISDFNNSRYYAKSGELNKPDTNILKISHKRIPK